MAETTAEVRASFPEQGYIEECKYPASPSIASFADLCQAGKVVYRLYEVLLLWLFAVPGGAEAARGKGTESEDHDRLSTSALCYEFFFTRLPYHFSALPLCLSKVSFILGLSLKAPSKSLNCGH
jgi:hypothetical protein